MNPSSFHQDSEELEDGSRALRSMDAGVKVEDGDSEEPKTDG